MDQLGDEQWRTQDFIMWGREGREGLHGRAAEARRAASEGGIFPIS